MKSNRNERHRLYMQLLQSREWRELRAAKIRDCQGLCERCNAMGIITAAKTVHHRTPVETGETLEAMRELCYRFDNLQLLCAEHHHRAHEELRSHAGQGTRYMPKQDITNNEPQQRLKQFVEKQGGVYVPPVKRGLRKTKYGWLTRDELAERQKAAFEEWKQRSASPKPPSE